MTREEILANEELAEQFLQGMFQGGKFKGEHKAEFEQLYSVYDEMARQIEEQEKEEKKITRKPKVLYTQPELYHANQMLTQLETIERETQALAFPLLLHIWNTCETVDELKEHYRREIDRLNYCTTDRDENGEQLYPYNRYDMRTVGEYAYHWNGVDIYKETALTLFRTLTQLLAYEMYHIDRDQHTPQVLPFSACEKSVGMYAYSD